MAELQSEDYIKNNNIVLDTFTFVDNIKLKVGDNQ